MALQLCCVLLKTFLVFQNHLCSLGMHTLTLCAHLVIGAKVVMKNKQIARYLGFNEDEKKRFEEKITNFCNSIQAISKISTEEGKQIIGVFVVLDDKENINQQTMFDAIDRVSEMHEKTSRFLMKTF